MQILHASIGISAGAEPISIFNKKPLYQNDIEAFNFMMAS